MNSVLRVEHGTGTGFFGIGNSGSTDCVKERFRAVTDALDQNFATWQHIDFVSEGCIGMTVRDTQIHRVEHTREVIDLYKQFEQEYIITGRSFTPAELGIWLIENQIVCLIQQQEQKSKIEYNDNLPFSKYSAKIYYKGTDISEYTLNQIQQLNRQRFADVIEDLKLFNFSSLLDKQSKNLLYTKKKHTLPPMDLAVKYFDNEFYLLKEHYHHKLSKRTNPKDRWYCANDTARYISWLDAAV
jgi:hypothetical protein